MIKIVFKNDIEVTVDTTGKAIIPGNENDWRLNIDTEDDSVTISDCNDDIVFCGKWPEILYIQKI